MKDNTDNPKRREKRIFITLLIVSLVLLATAVTGIVFSFIYIENLGLYQSLITGGAMVILVVFAVLTTVWYNKAYKD